MERLTEKARNSDGTAISKKSLIDREGKGYPSSYASAIVTKLAGFEDLEELIGVPIEILAKLFNDHIPEECKNPKKAIVLTDKEVDKWNEYKKAGDTVYCIEDGKIWDCIVDKVTISRTNGVWFEVKTPKSMPDICAIEYAENDFGERVFFTKDEAEQKLKEMEGSHDMNEINKKDLYMKLQRAKEIIDRKSSIPLENESFEDISKAYDIASDSINYRIGSPIKPRKCRTCDKKDCYNCNDNFNCCPNCDEVLDDDVESEPKYCPECGQALIWRTKDGFSLRG